MKKALKMLLNYLIFFLIGTVAGTFLYLIYHYLQNYVAGSSVKFISFPDILPSVFYVAACLVFLITPAIIYVNIKQSRSVFQLFFYIIISLALWNIVLPFCYKEYLKTDAKNDDIHKEEVLSKDYFRDNGNMIYYFSEDFSPEEGDSVSSVVIDKSEDGYIIVKDINGEDTQDLVASASPFRDVLMKNKFSVKNIFDFSLDEILERGNKCWNKGITFWIGFVTLGFVLCSIYGFVNLTSWKLINACTTFFASFLIIAFNKAYFNFFEAAIENSKIGKSEFISFLGKYVDGPVLCIINIAAGVIFILIGVIRFIIVKRTEAKSLKD